MMDQITIRISQRTLTKLQDIENLMIKSDGMAEQDSNYVIGKLCDQYLAKRGR